MPNLPVLLYGDRRLREKAETVDSITSELVEIVHEMIDTMRDAKGIGLAAPQVGIVKRFFVIDLSIMDEQFEPIVVFNPEILSQEGENIGEEGCLSIPDIREDVKRPERIRIRFTDLKGVVHETEFTGMLARVYCHEFDHLNGILFIDHLSTTRRKLLTSRLRKIAKEAKVA